MPITHIVPKRLNLTLRPCAERKIENTLGKHPDCDFALGTNYTSFWTRTREHREHQMGSGKPKSNMEISGEKQSAYYNSFFLVSIGGGDKMQSWNWPVPTSGVIFQPIWGRKL